MLMCVSLFSIGIMAQTTVFYETCGSAAPASGTRPAPADYTGWDNSAPIAFSGNVDLRSTSTINSHVWFAANNDKNFVISGINTSGKSDLKVSFKIACNSKDGDAAKMTLVAKDVVTGNTTPITIPSTPVVTANSYVEISNLSGIPATTNLELTFSFTIANNPTGFGYRLDDILISAGNAPVFSDNNRLASLSVSQGTLDPAFDPEVISYSVVLPAGTTTVPTESYTLEDTKATASVTRATTIPGTTSILVKAENGEENTYKINFSAEVPSGTWIETFEGVTPNKASYAVANFVGTAATWEIAGIVTDVVDASNTDKKNGARSARLRDPNSSSAASHYVMMQTDKPNGAGVISLYHGMYGSHTGAATWILEVSNDGGVTWNAYSQQVNEVPAEFTKISFTANITGNVRVKITKNNPTSAGTSTINIDDIQITDYDGSSAEYSKSLTTDVYVSDGILYLNNLPEGVLAYVYDMTGRLVISEKMNNTTVLIPMKQSGIYLIKLVSTGSSQTFKVLVK